MSINNSELPNNPSKKMDCLPPFTRCCMTIGNIPSSYLASLTYYEQLLWLCDFLKNTLIPAINNNIEVVKELQQLYIELKSYVDNYFKNLDVQQEINKKLDEMASDGTLDKIINQEIFGELNKNISNIKNSQNFQNLFLGAFFTPYENYFTFCVSSDGQNFADILPNVKLKGRDPHIFYNYDNKTWYVVCTNNGVYIYKSTNLIDWEGKSIEQNIDEDIIWGGELFRDKNNNIKLIFSAGKTGITHMKQYLCDLIDIDTLTFSTAHPLTLSQENIIDGSILLENGTYYLTCKNDTSYKQLIYSSNDLTNWILINDNVLGTNEPCERWNVS